MYHVRSDTLAGMRLSALFEKRDYASVTVPQAVKSLKKYMDSDPGRASPEGEAIKFYYANHVFSLLAAKYDPNEPLPPEALALGRGYTKLSSDLLARLIYYTLMIITREARHCGLTDSAITEKYSEFGTEFTKFVVLLTNHSEGNSVEKLQSSPPKMPLPKYCEGIAKVFIGGGFSSSFGGKPWSNIAETLRKLCAGEITPEMFADTAFTLAHNNGPMFNKGMLYSDFNQHYIYKLLDVQRSGQIPQFHAEGAMDLSDLDDECKKYIALAKSQFPHELGGYVDWFKVEALGALHKYPNEKKIQVSKYGSSAFSGVKGAAAVANLYHVGPGESDTVKVIVRKKPKKAA